MWVWTSSWFLRTRLRTSVGRCSIYCRLYPAAPSSSTSSVSLSTSAEHTHTSTYTTINKWLYQIIRIPSEKDYLEACVHKFDEDHIKECFRIDSSRRLAAFGKDRLSFQVNLLSHFLAYSLLVLVQEESTLKCPITCFRITLVQLLYVNHLQKLFLANFDPHRCLFYASPAKWVLNYWLGKFDVATFKFIEQIWVCRAHIDEANRVFPVCQDSKCIEVMKEASVLTLFLCFYLRVIDTCSSRSSFHYSLLSRDYGPIWIIVL